MKQPQTAPPKPPTSRTVDLDGPVHFVDFGGTGPPMVLVHGLGGSSVNWLAVGGALARDHRVYALDLPGFGRTPPAGRELTFRTHRRTVTRFLEEVAGERAVLVGNSMGGLVSLAVAAKRKKLVSALVLVAAALPKPPDVRHDPRVFGLFVLYMVPGAAELYLRRRKARMTPEEESNEMLELCTVDMGRIPREVVEAHYALARERRGMPWANQAFLSSARSMVPNVLFPAKVKRWIERVKAPTLLIHGDKDRLVSVAASRAACVMRSDFRLEVLDGIGHVPQMEAPDRFVATLRAFTSSVVARSRKPQE
jgi:pimeloyl-ACP methyl ester carboxylesterase